MLGIGHRTRMDRVKDVLKEASSYTEVMRDRKVQSRLRSAIDHGTVVTRRVRQDVGQADMTSRLTQDKKLRRNVRALVADLKGARDRIERKRRHRVRNALLLASGTGVVLAAIPSSRRWIANKMAMSENGASPAAAAY